MSIADRNDLVCQIAWQWVTREHEQPLDAEAREEMIDWLQADPAHRRAYEEAARLWLLAGLVPPKTDLPDGGESGGGSRRE